MLEKALIFMAGVAVGEVLMVIIEAFFKGAKGGTK
jgi:hypothetical protein